MLCIRFDVSHRCGDATGGSFKATSWHTKQIRLVLLYPYPDTVHGSPLHKTLSSTLLIGLSHPYDAPGRTCGLAIADCKFRAPLTPHLAQLNYSIPILKKKQAKCRCVYKKRFACRKLPKYVKIALHKGDCMLKYRYKLLYIKLNGNKPFGNLLVSEAGTVRARGKSPAGILP